MEDFIGVISDTHGLLRPEAAEQLRGARQIIHAGDVGHPHILETLQQIAPLVAVRGNVDRGPWSEGLPLTEVVEAWGHTLYVLHDLQALDLDPKAAGFAAVISGHSHHPSIEQRRAVLYLNPGSAGPRRFRLPVSMARLEARNGMLEAHLIELDLNAARRGPRFP